MCIISRSETFGLVYKSFFYPFSSWLCHIYGTGGPLLLICARANSTRWLDWKHRDENKPNLLCFGNLPHGFSHLRDLVNTDAPPWFQVPVSGFGFKFQVSVSRFSCKIQFQVSVSSFSFKFQFKSGSYSNSCLNQSSKGLSRFQSVYSWYNLIEFPNS